MRIKIITVGKTDDKAIQSLISVYDKRLKHYIKTEWQIIPDIKNRKKLDQKSQLEQEGKLIMAHLSPSDRVVLLDERGTMRSSEELSNWLQQKINTGLKVLVFIIGGPYGFSEDVYKRADEKLSLSKMTFSHQMIRLFFIEQLYRACTILNGEPYHHK